MPRHSFRLQFRFDIIKRIKILYLARDPAFESRRIKKRDRPDPALTGQQRLPEMQKRVGELEEEKSRLIAQVAELKREAEFGQERVRRLEGVQQRLPEMERQMMELLSGLRMVLKGGDADVSRGFEANK